MRLHQLQIEFNAEHDRLLLRVATNDAQEVLLWLTRRCVKLLWPALLKVAETIPEIARQADPEAKKALVGFHHEKALRQADFSKPYEQGRERPLGAEPILVARLQTRRNQDGHTVLSLLPVSGQGIHLTLDEGLLHSFCRLLQSAVEKADWDYKLTLPQPAIPAATSGSPSIN